MNLPNASVEAVEEAKEFAAVTVRPEDFAKAVEEMKYQPSRPFVEPVSADVETVEPEEVAVLDSDNLQKVAINPEIIAALAAEGLTIDQEAVNQFIEENNEVDDAVEEFRPLDEAFPPSEPVDLVDVTPEVFRDLKEEINASFSELAALVLEQQRQIDEIEARLAEYNKRGGHRI